MNFKKSRDELGRLINAEVNTAVYSRLNSLAGQPMTSLGYIIAEAVAYGTQRAVEILMENTYTDQEFEEDIGLKEK
jgi:hypothetical protein